jgi:hypothetical protein
MDQDDYFWKQLKEESKKKRWDNQKKSLEILKENNIPVKMLNEESAHYRVGQFDFWPTTGKYYNQKTKEKGRGVFNLIRKLKP